MNNFFQILYYCPLLSVGSVGDHTYGTFKSPPPPEKKNTFLDRWLAKGVFFLFVLKIFLRIMKLIISILCC
jgi:hypothetical protein